MDQKISPDLAGKVLAADIRNVVQKVQDGKTLTAGERDLFREFALEQEQLVQARQAALLRKWLRGGRLAADERAELGMIVPEASAPDPATIARPAYQLEQKDYAARYDTNVRTIKRWVAAGRARTPHDFPPLDEPAEMEAWWARVMSNRMPRKTRDAIASLVAKPAPKSSPAADPSRPVELPLPAAAPVAPSPNSTPPGDDEKIGIAATLERMQSAEREAYRRYMEALRGDEAGNVDDGKVRNALRMWSELAEKMRALEKSAADVLAASGESLKKSDVRAALIEIHSNIASGIRQLLRRNRSRLGLDPTKAKEQDAIWEEEIDLLFQEWRNSAFAEQLDLQQ